MAEKELVALEERISSIRKALAEKEAAEQQRVAEQEKRTKTRVKLIVGGMRYETSRAVLAEYPESMLESLVSGRHTVTVDDDGYIFIDRDGEMFRHVLNAVRVGRLILPAGFSEFELLAAELDYYGLPFVVDRASNKAADITRSELLQRLSTKSSYDFRGTRFCGLDLSNVTFMHLGGAEFVRRLNYCDFSGTVLDNAYFPSSVSGAGRMYGAIFDAARGKKICFFESDLTSATFSKCQFISCNFSKAVLTSAKFEDCDLSGSKFENSNLSKASFVRCYVGDASFKGADFAGGVIESTDFGHANVTDAKNLPPVTSSAKAEGDS